MQTQSNKALSKVKSAWSRLRAWIKSGAADDSIRVTDEWDGEEEFSAHEAITPVGPSASFSTRVKRHQAHPHERATAAESYENRHHYDDDPAHEVPDSLGNGLAARMLDSALGGSPDDDGDDDQVDMHVIDPTQPDSSEVVPLALSRRRERSTTHH